jgi:hypothetical protein
MTAGRVSDQIRLFLGSTESLLVRRGPPRAGYRYHTVMGFSAARGRAFDPPADRLPDGVLPGVPGYCFSNAHNLVRADRRFLYAEGYAVRAGVPLPVAHGWAVERRTGAVVERTWVGGSPPLGYFGVVFTRKYSLRVFRRRDKNICVLVDDWVRGWPLLRMSDAELAGVLVTDLPTEAAA